VAQFQSSPVPKDGCNVYVGVNAVAPFTFQSSPVPKDGCNGHRHVVWCGYSGFNPHPSRRTGATAFKAANAGTALLVSILTRPEGRVQLELRRSLFRALTVSILTRPEGRVQLKCPRGRRR